MPDKPKPISPLRQRMIDDMTARRFSEATRKDYVRHVRTIAAFLDRSPDTATSEDLRRFQLHLAQQQVSPWSINAAIAAPAVLLHRDARTARPRSSAERLVNEPRKAPVVLSREEAARLLEARAGRQVQGRAQRRLWRGPQGVRGREPGKCPRHRQRAHDAQGREQEQGAAGSLRDAFPQLLELLRDWWRAARPQGLKLFPRPEPDRNPDHPPSSSIAPSPPPRIWRASPSAYRRTPCGIAATHLLEQDVDIRVIQVLLGHAKLETTALYTRVAGNTIRDIKSPLERLGVNLASRSPPA